AARLSHPHITNVYDYGERADGTPYVVMELVEGQSLAQRMAAGPLPWRMAVRVAAQVASALAAAHAQGLVHRDVTPASAVLARRLAELADLAERGPVVATAPAPRPRVAVGGTRRQERWVPPPRARRWPWTLSGLVVLVLTFLAGVVFAGGRPNAPVQAAPASPTPPPPAATCEVSYSFSATVSSEFGVDLAIRNTGTTDITGWTLVF